MFNLTQSKFKTVFIHTHKYIMHNMRHMYSGT